MTQPAAALDLGEVARRLMNVVRPGTIAETDLPNARARVQYASGPDGPVLSGWLPWMAAAGENRDWRPPSIGEQVLILSPCGELSAGWILAGAYRDEFPAPDSSAAKRVTTYRDGAIVSYDSEAHQLSAVLPEGGAASIAAPEGVTITGDVTITGAVGITGDVTITGNGSASGDLSARGAVSDPLGSMQEMRGVYNSHTHLLPGAPPSPSPAPTEQMT